MQTHFWLKTKGVLEVDFRFDEELTSATNGLAPSEGKSPILSIRVRVSNLCFFGHLIFFGSFLK